jgi:transcriptional regulator with XRE-family HTH domain
MQDTIATRNPNRIAVCRERAGLKREHIAVRLDVNPSTVYRWERSGVLPSDKLRALAEILSVDVDYLMGWDDPLDTATGQGRR